MAMRRASDVDNVYSSLQRRKEMRATMRRLNKESVANTRLPSPLKPGDILFAVMGLEQVRSDGRRTLDRVWYFEVTETNGELGRETIMRRLVDRRERLTEDAARMFAIPRDLTFPRVGVSVPDIGNYMDLPPIKGNADHLGAVRFFAGIAAYHARLLPFLEPGSTRIYRQTAYCDGYPTVREQRHNPDWRETGIVNPPPQLPADPSFNPSGYLDAYLGI